MLQVQDRDVTSFVQFAIEAFRNRFPGFHIFMKAITHIIQNPPFECVLPFVGDDPVRRTAVLFQLVGNEKILLQVNNSLTYA